MKVNGKKIAIAIIAILVFAGGILYLIHINKDKKSKNALSISEENITVFQKLLDDTLNGDTDSAEMPEFLSSLKKSYSCKVKSVTPAETDDTYTAIVSVTYADVSDKIIKYLEEHSNEQFDEEKLNKAIVDIVSNSEQTTSECEIYFIPNGDSYSPVFTEEIIDKMYGGIYSAYYNKLDEVAAGMKGSEQG